MADMELIAFEIISNVVMEKFLVIEAIRDLGVEIIDIHKELSSIKQ